MDSRLLRIVLIATACAAAALLLLAGAALAGAGQPIVELRHEAGTNDVTVPSTFTSQAISGTNTSTKQEYKFQRQREGKWFSYTVANLLPNTDYSVELSFVEHDFSASGKRVFNVYLTDNGTYEKKISLLDIYAKVGKDSAYQVTYTGRTTDADGRLGVRFRSYNEAGCRDYATVCTVRVYRGSANAVEIDASKSRLNMEVPNRFTNSTGQESYETALGRLGSRFWLNLLPQKLTARLSSLGEGTGDLEDLVLGLWDGADMRCLPFTDRYQVWDNMAFSQTMTSQTYTCTEAGIPYEVEVKFRSPFYPGAEELSGAPFMYVDVTVTNNSGSEAQPDLIFARPHRLDFTYSGVADYTTAEASGCRSSTNYTYYDETFNSGKAKDSVEALAVPLDEAADVNFRGLTEADFTDFTPDTLWTEYVSPMDYPKTYPDYKKPLYSFYPRGYSGAVWTPTLAAGASDTKHFVLAGYVDDKILRVSNSSYTDSTYEFKYTKQFANVDAVVDYALSQRTAGDAIETRSEFFDSTFSSEDYLKLPTAGAGPAKELMAYGFQSYLMNTWWAVSDYAREWFSTWEGTCRFHSTIDAEYNQAWFYYYFWPDLLKMTMDEWALYTKTAQQGVYMSHDMGMGDAATGQAYPNNMAVEENANYILMLYKYWKSTGDTSYMKGKLALVRELAGFMTNCDTNGNGMPDQYTGNTVDQGSLAIQFGKDQAYLGVKCLAAHRAAREMALADPTALNVTFAAACQGQVEAINQALDYDMWLSDHFAVAWDSDVLAEDREAYSIYPSNGLVYLLNGTRAAGFTSTNTARMRTDLANSTAATLKTYGCTHSSYDAYNEWVSQNVWRDQAACMLGVNLNGANPTALWARYWSLEQYFAKSLWGTFWDVVVYPGGTGGGASERLTPALPGRSGGGTRSAAATTYEQSLGYYPRGVSSLGLIDAAAGLTLDVPDDALYYEPSAYPLKVPVFPRADWAAASEADRVPVLDFASAGSPPTVTNPTLLPAPARRNVADITGMSAGGHAISPNSDGVNDAATVSYNLPLASEVSPSIWEGSQRVRSFASADRGAGASSFTWDGRDGGGAVVGDGVYTARIDAVPEDAAHELRPAAAPVFVNNSVPDLALDWYLAEGFTGRNATGGEFEEYITIQNPEAQPAAVEVTFMMPGGANVERSYTVPAASRFTITVDEILPDAEVSARVSSDRPVAVERAMYFNDRRAGHDSIGVSEPSKTWYLAEGYTADDFDEYVLVQNPGDTAADVTATFMTPGAGNETRQYQVGARSRFTIHVDDVIPAQSVSTAIESSQPVVVERAQYLNYMTSGTCSLGACSTSRTWFLAEGYTDQGFETWVVIQNPQDSYNNVTVIFMEPDGSNTFKRYLLPPQTRFTVLADAYLEASEISVKVRAQHPVLVERAMYWNDRSDGHACIGTPTPDSEWYLAEGYTDQGFETYLTVQNPGDDARAVTMTFMEPGGMNTYRSYTVGARSRFTVSVDDVLPAAEVSTKVSANGPVIVERSLYFNGRSGGTGSLGVRGR